MLKTHKHTCYFNDFFLIFFLDYMVLLGFFGFLFFFSKFNILILLFLYFVNLQEFGKHKLGGSTISKIGKAAFTAEVLTAAKTL